MKKIRSCSAYRFIGSVAVGRISFKRRMAHSATKAFTKPTKLSAWSCKPLSIYRNGNHSGVSRNQASSNFLP